MSRAGTPKEREPPAVADHPALSDVADRGSGLWGRSTYGGYQGVLVSGTGNASALVDSRIQFVNDRSSTLTVFTYPTFTDGGTVAEGYYGGK